MEEFKQISEIDLPDNRNLAFLTIDKSTGFERRRELSDIHSYLEDISLNANVPEIVADHFTTAKNLLLYSWFVYRFIPVAELHAISTLELALKIKSEKQHQSLRKLIKLAISKNWIKDEDFQIYKARATNKNTETDSTYTKILFDSLPYLRNEYAHGSSSISPDGYTTLLICSDFINAIFQPNKI